MGDQKALFAERVNRINAGAQFEHADVIGNHTMALYDKRKKRGAYTKRAPGLPKIISLPIAFVVGAGSMQVGRMVYFHLAQFKGMPEAFLDLGERGMFVSAIIIALILMGTFRLYEGARLPAMMAGFLLMMFAEAPIAMIAPELWAQMFSPQYMSELAREAAAA